MADVISGLLGSDLGETEALAKALRQEKFVGEVLQLGTPDSGFREMGQGMTKRAMTSATRGGALREAARRAKALDKYQTRAYDEGVRQYDTTRTDKLRQQALTRASAAAARKRKYAKGDVVTTNSGYQYREYLDGAGNVTRKDMRGNPLDQGQLDELSSSFESIKQQKVDAAADKAAAAADVAYKKLERRRARDAVLAAEAALKRAQMDKKTDLTAERDAVRAATAKHKMLMAERLAEQRALKIENQNNQFGDTLSLSERRLAEKVANNAARIGESQADRESRERVATDRNTARAALERSKEGRVKPHAAQMLKQPDGSFIVASYDPGTKRTVFTRPGSSERMSEAQIDTAFKRSREDEVTQAEQLAAAERDARVSTDLRKKHGDALRKSLVQVPNLTNILGEMANLIRTGNTTVDFTTNFTPEFAQSSQVRRFMNLGGQSALRSGLAEVIKPFSNSDLDNLVKMMNDPNEGTGRRLLAIKQLQRFTNALATENNAELLQLDQGGGISDQMEKFDRIQAATGEAPSGNLNQMYTEEISRLLDKAAELNVPGLTQEFIDGVTDPNLSEEEQQAAEAYLFKAIQEAQR